MSILTIIAELIGIFIGFGIAAELVTRGIHKLEPILGQGMAAGVILGLLGAIAETMFVTIAVLHGSYSIALGSAIGGNVILFTLGMGMVGVVYFLKWKKNVVMKYDYHIESVFLLLATLAIALLLLYGRLDRISGSLLFILYLIYVVYRYINSRHFISKNIGTPEGRKLVREGLTYILISALIVLFLSNPFIDLLTNLSATIAVPAIWLALFISPIAAELEENLGAYKIARRKENGGSIAIVSFIGGKLQNNTMLLGIIGIIASTPVLLGVAYSEFVAVIGVNLIAMFAIRKGILSYSSALVLVLLYFTVIILTLLL